MCQSRCFHTKTCTFSTKHMANSHQNLEHDPICAQECSWLFPRFMEFFTIYFRPDFRRTGDVRRTGGRLYSLPDRHALRDGQTTRLALWSLNYSVCHHREMFFLSQKSRSSSVSVAFNAATVSSSCAKTCCKTPYCKPKWDGRVGLVFFPAYSRAYWSSAIFEAVSGHVFDNMAFLGKKSRKDIRRVSVPRENATE